MFVVLLEFSYNRAQAGEFMAAHKDWLQRGFDDGVFVLAGSFQPNRGGAILAYGSSLENLQARVAEDPFVANGVVSAEILEISASRGDERLTFLLD